MEPGEQTQDLAGPGLRVDPALLEHEPDPGPQRRAVPDGIQAEHPDRALVGLPVSLDGLDRGCLARAVGPKQGHDRARRDRQVDPIDDRPSAVPFAQAAHDDGRVVAGLGGCRHRRMAASWRSKSALVTSPI